MRLSNLFIPLLILLPIFLFFGTRGVVMHDEGYILLSAQKIFDGQLPYRDFYFAYTPLSIFLTSLSFLLFSPSILSSRILMIILNLATTFLIYKTLLFSTKNRMYAVLASSIFIAWGPTHINFSHPIMYAIFTTMLVCYLLFKFMETRKALYLFFAGISTFLVFLAHQNFGIGILVPVIIYFLVKHARSYSFILPYLFGYLWGIIIFCIYLLLTNSFAPFFYDFILHQLFVSQKYETLFIYNDGLITTPTRTAFYLLPLIFSAASFVLIFIRRRFHLLFLPTTVAIFYIVGIRPTTDYVHLVPFVALLGIPVGLYLRYNISSTLRIFLLLFSFLLLAVGFHSALFKGYYRWDEPLIQHSTFSINPKAQIFVTNKTSQDFEEITKISQMFTNKEDYIYINAYNPILYFITNRQEPLHNTFLTTSINQQEYYEKVQGHLIAKKIKIMILIHNSLNSLPIKNYVLNNYKLYKTVNEFELYLRNP